MLVHLITGQTYVRRSSLHAAGGIWNDTHKGYLFPVNATLPRNITEDEALDITMVTVADDALTPLTGDALRAYREKRKERYAERLQEQAAAADKRAEAADNRVKPHERELLALGEPIKVGHHSEGKHRKLLARAQKAASEAYTESNKAAQLRRRAEMLAPVKVKGDTERTREEQRQAAAALIEVGDTVRDAIWGVGTVARCNKKTFTVRYDDRGFSQTIDKSAAMLVAKGCSNAAKPEPKFQLRDRVIVTQLCAKYKGTVVRRTSRGYSVEYELFGKKKTETFAEYQLVLDV